MASGLVNRLVPNGSVSLGVVRAIVHSVFLLSILFTSFSALSELPVTILRPTGAMKLLPWRVYDQLLTHAGMQTLQWALIVSLLFGAAGLFTSLSTKLSLLLVVFYQGLLRSFGHFNHDEMLSVYYLLILAFSPCGDRFSLDQLLRTKLKSRPAIAYSYPIFLMWALMAWVYFSSALIKLRVAGVKYLSPDNLPVLAIFHSLDNLHDTSFRLAFWLPQVRSYLPIAVTLVLIWELIFPLAIFLPKVRWWLLTFGFLFHISTLLFMNIFFPFQLAMYLVFIDWGKVFQKFAGWRQKAATSP